MRVEFVIVGAVLAVLGAALWVVPLTSASSQTEIPLGEAYDFGVPSPLVIGSVPYSATWTATSPANVTIYACGANSACPDPTNHSVVAHGTGSTGSLAWTSKSGQYFLLVPNATVNVTLTYREPVSGGLAGLALLGAGALIAVVGLLVKRRPVAQKTSPTSGAVEEGRK
ncbi:MAG TPA: hypothetical protein VJQ43_03005 [Thermoplasmata archaeon]|nr:hypothetical protein [Thermoplasmata archaeon]